LALLDAFDALAHGDKGEWLRQNGLYAAQLSIWRKERREHGEAGLEPKTPGQKPKDPRDVQIEQLSREVSKLRKRAELAEALVDLQKKVWCLDEWTPSVGSAS
jgi:transposase-like protein